MNRTRQIFLFFVLLLWTADAVLCATPSLRRARRRGRRARVVAVEYQTVAGPAVTACSWPELPAMEPAADQELITHYTTIDGRRHRNFSMLYDYSDRIALWVAYPVHDCYLGESGRSDAWGFDPIIPRPSQLNMSRSGFTDDNGCTTYDRGHQIPSADRTVSREANAATFYYTNMTPQHSTLNRGLWGKLEAFVRNNTPACDTLWVVTGCALTTADEPTLLRARHNTQGDSITVPRAYFKVLLRSGVRGTLPIDSTAECIGFWIPNVAPSSGKLTPSWAVSVNRIEELTGFDFFPWLSDEAEARVVSDAWLWK